MDFPRAFFIVGLLFLFYLASQAYLFSRILSYLWRRMQDPRRRRAISSLVAAFFLFMLYPIAWHFLYGLGVYEPYAWILRGFLALWAVGSAGAAAVLFGCDLARQVSRHLSTGDSLPDPGRRRFLKGGVGAAAAAPFFLSGYGVFHERRRFRVEHIDLPLEGLSSAFSQFSMVQLTDIHVGPFMPEEELQAYVEAVNRLQPDLIALTGDFVSNSAEEALPCARALSGLKARYGVFACLGNHDVYARAEEELARLFGENGIRLLRNEAVTLRAGNSAMSVLGIDDLRWGKPNLARALRAAGREPGEVRLLLSHRPEVFPAAARGGLDIVLAGHYHGGQLKLTPEPGSLSVARLITPYPEGLFHLSRPAAGDGRKQAALFVSRGIGITGLPVRINCPPQIAHLTLRRT